MKIVPKVRTRSIAGRGNGNTLVGRHADACELANNPTAGELVIKHNGIAASIVLADATETAPQRGDA